MRRLTFSEEVRDGSNSSWEDLHFLKILFYYWLVCYQEGGTRLQVVAVCYGSRTAFPRWLFTGSSVCTSCSKRYHMGVEQWLLKNQAFHSADGIPMVTPCAQLQYWSFGNEQSHSLVIPLLLKASFYWNKPFLHTKSLLEMYQEIVLGPKWRSCGFFLIHGYDSFYAYYWWQCYKIIFWQRYIVSGNFLALSCFLKKNVCLCACG